ncbi:hypothetical protein GGS23DRAFT_172942 [Durotheca rogersii]|uniref:uncharacterized protein n=1 Tax=Durotheca rogersii TaxID=419775 RepID=UPI0022204C9F|nr:uncharacterized protein GGS23DRAFT_172942 [Durotheca rogersii]KAI5867352.1 hypothetical protein GGS23DRAFT_172942 [Durotheca rogersii]
MPISFNSPRPFSATSQVHPSYLPALHKSVRLERRIATATVVAIGIGYGLARYNAGQWREHQAQPGQLPVAQVSPVAVEARRQNEALEAAYGDRSSLAELEAAVAAYETRRRQA